MLCYVLIALLQSFVHNLQNNTVTVAFTFPQWELLALSLKFRYD